MYTTAADAATVMLLRPSREAGVKDIEVLLVLRNSKSSFVPGYHVFPGGSIDPEDYEPGMERFISGIGRKQAAQILPDMSHHEKALGAWIAGIRETFEEVGMLIARRKDGTPVTICSREESNTFNRYRQALIRKEIKFSQMLEAEDISLPGDCLHYFSHWITPELFPVRYDVRFFATEAPAGQTVICDGVELTDHVWLRPCVALKDYEMGKIGMVLPQIMTLVELSRFKTVAEVIVSVRERNIPAHLTKIKNIDGKDVEVMPDGTVFETRPPVYSWPDEKK
jgi:8-oxo-dGTP pyrophosphatase MutT (NUDIX family)